MIQRRTAVQALVATAASNLVSPAWAQERFPSKPVRIVVPYAAGTATDSSARMLADGLAKAWDVPVTIENVAAASGTVGTATVAKAPPDGHTLVMVASNHVINPHLYRDLPYDTVRDFTPICMVARTQIVLVVSADSDVRDMKGFIAKAKRQPGRLNYGSAGNGSVGHLAMEQLKLAAGLYVTHIPYRGQNQALTDLLGGQVDLALPALGVAQPFIRGGRMRALGLAAHTRSNLAPDIPTVQEQTGVPLDAIAWWGLMGPRGMAPELVETINAAFRAQLRTPAVVERMRGLNADITAGTPKDMADTIRTDLARVGDTVRQARLKLD